MTSRVSPRSSRLRMVPMSVMMPVNMGWLSFSDALVDVEPVAAKQAAVDQAPPSMRLRKVRKPDVAKRGPPAADQDRRAIEQQSVAAVGGQEGRCRARAAFDQHRIDVGDRFGRCNRDPAN